MFQSKVVEKLKTHILCSKTFCPKIIPFMKLCGKKFGTATEATDDK